VVVDVRRRFQPLVDLYDKTASLQDRTVGTGGPAAELARQFGAGGYVGRASGRHCDARRWPGYAPYSELDFEVPVREDGDVNGRLWIRVGEVEQVPSGDRSNPRQAAGCPIRAEQSPGPATAASEGMAIVESFRATSSSGSELTPTAASTLPSAGSSWFQWPLLEAAI